MKKTAVFLGTVVGFAAFAFAGCSGADNFAEKSYLSGDGEVESIVIEVTDRELQIGASEDDQVRIDYFDGEKEYLDISLSEDGVLRVELTSDKSWTDFIGTKPSAEYRKIEVRIPDGMAALSATTTNEDITVTSLSFAESVTLDANGGDVVCGRVGVGKSIGLTAKNGNIRGTVLGGWDDFSISCEIKKGDCNLPEYKEGGAKSFAASCNNGDIDIDFVY